MTSRKELTLLNINITLTIKGWDVRRHTYTVKETAKSYVNLKPENCYSPKIISKTRVGMLDTVYLPRWDYYGYSCFCLPENESEITEKIKSQIKMDVEDRLNTITSIGAFLAQ